MPFFSDAPSGKSMVSTLDVEEIRVGSEMSDLEIVFLRKTPAGRYWAIIWGGGEKVEGVVGPDSGGVMFCANGEDATVGDGRAELFGV